MLSTRALTSRSTGRRWTRAAAVLSVVALLALSGCGEDEPEAAPTGDPSVVAPETAEPTPSETPSASPTPTAEPPKPSDDLGEISVKGGFGDDPTVEVKSPWAVDETRTKVLSEGDGPELTADGSAEIDYQGVNGRTGEVFDSSFERGQSATFNLGQVVPGFSKGLTGQKVGSRVLIAMPGEDGYDSAGGSPQAGIELGDTLIFVVDVLGAPLSGPEGKDVAPKDGLPTVGGPVDEPTIKVPDADPPAELVVQPLIEGDGKAVTATDTVTVDYLGATWDGGKTIESSYGDAPQETTLDTLIPGFRDALVDRKVGSRLLLVIPPDQAYPDGNQGEPAVEPGQTLVYVVDILFTQPGQ